jgi:predicted nucleic acid-binding protein
VNCDQELLLRTIELYEGHRLDFAEAYLYAAADVSGIGTVASFDRGIDKVASVQLLRADTGT